MYVGIGLMVASTMLLVPAVMGLMGPSFSEETANLFQSWFSRRDVYNRLVYRVIDHLGDEDCSFNMLEAWAQERGVETGKIEVAQLDCTLCESGKRRGVVARTRIMKGEAIVRAPWTATITTE